MRGALSRALWLGVLLAGLLAGPAAAQLRRPKPKSKPKAVVETPLSLEVAKLLKEARQLQAQYKDSEALARYEQVLAKVPSAYEALWQAAVLSVRIGARYTDETRKAAYFSAARLYASRALVVRPEGAEGNYAEALALANQATLLPARRRLLLYKEMKPAVFKAVERQPNFADAWQLLGRWHYRVAHYNLFERVYSRLFLGGTPAGASTQAALNALTIAHQLDPTRIQYAYDLARVHLNRGQHRQARAVLEQAVALPPVTAEELTISRSCRKLLEQLNRKQTKRMKRGGRSVE
jgi:tetratricopeptide (TPR) repeat protein